MVDILSLQKKQTEKGVYFMIINILICILCTPICVIAKLCKRYM